NSGASGWTAGPWQPAGRPVNGRPAVLTALLQPTAGAVGGGAVAAARLDSSRLRVVLYAGTTEPGGTWTDQGAVVSALRPSLVATFNSGFLLKSSRGGFYADGRAAVALRDGAASLVIFQDGSATVGAWGRDVRLGANVAAVRQNLELLVDGGHPAPNISTNVLPTWGFTLHGAIPTWRSAVGVDGAGQLLYVGGPGLDPSGLAGAMIAVGAVRAMELDINPAWVSFTTFTDGPGGLTGTKLMPAMNPSANHFLSPSPRDFFAAFAR
ncbi:MAG: hypothetical protein M3083_22005, partial [Actinomycetota bacterium]|nr:hypothetical protein [Actinomycetota bacterium]